MMLSLKGRVVDLLVASAANFSYYLLLAGQVLNDGPCLWRLLGCGVVDKNLGGDPQRSQQ